MRHITLMVIALIFSQSLFADISQTPIANSGKSDVVSIRHDAALWGLSEEEFQRYKKITRGPIGNWNKNIDPVMVLGMFAESEAEQRRYAELYAQQEFDLIVRTQRFEQSYREAFTRLFPDSQVIDSEKMKGYYASQERTLSTSNVPEFLKAIQQNDRLMYFPSKECQGCIKTIAHLQSMLTRHSGLRIDIYIRGVNSVHEAREWANTYNVAVEFVRQGMMTINVDNGSFRKLRKKSNSATPYYLFRGDDVFAVNPSDVMML